MPSRFMWSRAETMVPQRKPLDFFRRRFILITTNRLSGELQYKKNEAIKQYEMFYNTAKLQGENAPTPGIKCAMQYRLVVGKPANRQELRCRCTATKTQQHRITAVPPRPSPSPSRTRIRTRAKTTTTTTTSTTYLHELFRENPEPGHLEQPE